MGPFGLFNLFLLALENILDDNFFCPCKSCYNILICFMYCAVPALGCFIWTWCFLDLSPLRENEENVEKVKEKVKVKTEVRVEDRVEVQETVVEKTVGEQVEKSRSKGQKLYSLLSVSIWLSLFFLDSRYVACAGSYWEGIYTKSATLEIVKWCKPIGNETSVLESEQWTLYMMIISQVSSEGKLF